MLGMSSIQQKATTIVSEQILQLDEEILVTGNQPTLRFFPPV